MSILDRDQGSKIRAFTLEQDNKLLVVLDQTKLPCSIRHINVSTTQDAWTVIRNMNVRGAPCIAAVGCLSIMVELKNILAKQGPNNLHQALRVDSTQVSGREIFEWIIGRCEELVTSRPTAVNLSRALEGLCSFAERNLIIDSAADAISLVEKWCLKALSSGQSANRRLGDFGAQRLGSLKAGKPISVLTHCNTGSLATVDYGTALGVIRSLHGSNMLKMAYCTETRPFNQGSRLTAWELVQDNIPATLIADSMVAGLLADNKVDAIVVGADRVARNGDTANKIGTFQIAVLAKHFEIPFFVASPTQTIDLKTESGQEIVIEQRPSDEMRYVGSVQLAPSEVNIWNPCFDVTPARYIQGIITEFGTCRPDLIESFVLKFGDKENETAWF